jgi:DNA-binding protein Alba
MMTAIAQEAPRHQTAVQNNAIPPHVLIVGKKNAVDYIAPALFRLGSFGQLVVRAKGSFSIVTAVNVAEMVRRDIEGLEARPVIGTEEVVIEGVTRRVSFIEIHLAKPMPKVEAAPVVVVEAAPAIVVKKCQNSRRRSSRR